MRVLVACECSGRVRDAFRLRGHDAWSCDLLACDGDDTHHLRGDVRDVLADHWELMIAHPPCTYLARSFRPPFLPVLAQTADALAFVRLLLDAPVVSIALENPAGVISSQIRKPDQIIHPHYFGEDASKLTCLWLKNLPPLRATQHVPPRMVNGVPRWGNQTDRGQSPLAPGPRRAALRSITYQGIADAMATQWGTRHTIALGLPFDRSA